MDSYGNSYSILPLSDIPAGQESAAKFAMTVVDYNSHLEVLARNNRTRLTGIVCTIGPVSREPEFLLKMIDTGMNIARMNFSHGSHEYHGQTIANCRTAATLYKEAKGFTPSLAIALDTKGPEIRTGLLEGDDGRKELILEAGQIIRLTTDDTYKEKCTLSNLWLDYKNITKVMTKGQRIFIDDGLISIIAKEIGSDFIVGEVENGGNLGSRKGCNLPGTNTDLPAVSDKDIEDLLFGVEQGVDMVFASFIRDAENVRQIRKVLGEKGKHILIIPKIENQEGVNNIDEIIAESDGIMVARGDMGIEIPPEKVFIAQKKIIAKCNQAGKPVICATQMLESMVKKPRPTRAEGSDVANAVLDGADCVMLSGETAKGDYPLQCIKTMASISREAECCMWNQRFFEELLRNERSLTFDNTACISISAVHASYTIKASAIIILTTTGRTAVATAKYRPICPILSISRDEVVSRQSQLHRGIIPLHYDESREDDWSTDIDNRINYAIRYGKQFGIVKANDPIIAITGWRKGPGSSNTVRILYVDQN